MVIIWQSVAKISHYPDCFTWNISLEWF